MLFHVIEPARRDETADELQLSNRAGRGSAKVNVVSVLWAAAMIMVFVVASFVAHRMQFAAGETIFLNLTVALTSASAGVFIGEKLAIKQGAG